VSLLVDHLGTYLEDQGVGTVAAASGWGIYRLERPDSPVTVISLHEEPGFPPDPYLSTERPIVDIIVRGSSEREAAEKCREIFRLLHGKQNVRLGSVGSGVDAFTIEALNSPHPIGEEQVGAVRAHLYRFNAAFHLRELVA